MRKSIVPELGVQLVDANHVLWAQIPADKSGKFQTPTSDVEILRATLAHSLMKRLQSTSDAVKKDGGHSVEFLYGDAVTALHQDEKGVTVTFKIRHNMRRFDLVIGADGVQSLTRSQVWGDEGENRGWNFNRLGMLVLSSASPNAIQIPSGGSGSTPVGDGALC